MDRDFGSLDGVDAFQKAENIVSQFNSSCQLETGAKEITYAKIEQTITGETVVVILDPFMLRVHQGRHTKKYFLANQSTDWLLIVAKRARALAQ